MFSRGKKSMNSGLRFKRLGLHLSQQKENEMTLQSPNHDLQRLTRLTRLDLALQRRPVGQSEDCSLQEGSGGGR